MTQQNPKDTQANKQQAWGGRKDPERPDRESTPGAQRPGQNVPGMDKNKKGGAFGGQDRNKDKR